MATIREVAKRAGVSIGTVSRYLNGVKVRQDNAEAIARAVTDLDFQPSFFGRALTKQRGFSIGVLVENAGNVFVSSSIGGLESGFEHEGYSSYFVDFQGDLNLLRKKVEFLQERMVDGFVVFLFEADVQKLGYLKDLDIPIVFVNSPLEDVGADSIVVDNARSTSKVVGAMLDAGHERVGLIAFSPDSYAGAARAKGWREAYVSRGLAVRDAYARACAPTKQGGYEAARSLLDAGEVTALFASNYYTALGALKAMNERGLRPGIDIGFASFDDYDASDIIYPPLTVVRQPEEAISREIVTCMCERIGRGTAPQGIHMLPCEVHLTDSIRGGLKR